MANRPIVVLDDSQLEQAFAVGDGRDRENIGKGDAVYYDPDRMEDNRVASRASAVAELVVATFLKLNWGAEVWKREDHEIYRDTPDVGPNIEVRRTRNAQAPLTVRKRDLQRKPDRVVVSVFVDSQDLTRGQIMGWLPAAEAWDQGYKPHYPDPRNEVRVVSYPFLYPITDTDRLANHVELPWLPRLTSA